MAKTLVIAEKPSVGRDVARVLPGPFAKNEGFLEGPEHVITWAVGHLVQLAEPDEYDAKFKKWKMGDLPIVPDRFKLVVRDERSKKQMTVVSQQLKRDDVDDVINACDAGREGELIFAYLYEKAGSKKPVQRLWLQSMTKEAMNNAFASLKPASELRDARGGRPLALGGRLDRRDERDARRDDPPALLLRRRRVAGPRADADAGHPRPPRGRDRRLQARALLARRRGLRGRRQAHLRRPLPRGRPAAHRHRRRGRGDRRGGPRPARHDHQARQDQAHREGAAAVRPHVAAARRQHALRLLRAAHACRPRSACTRSTRCSPTRAPTRATSPAT